MKKNRGFTMVELLAAILIMGILMVIGVSSVINVLNDNRTSTYVEDAKKLLTAGESKYRADTNMALPLGTNHCSIATLKYLDTSEFENPPNEGSYDKLKSFVLVKRTASKEMDERYEYSVQLIQVLKDKKSYKGIPLAKENSLYKKSEYKQLIANLDQSSLKTFDKIDSSNKESDALKAKLLTYINTKFEDDYCTSIDNIYASDTTQWDDDTWKEKSEIKVKCDVTSEGTTAGVNLSCSCTLTDGSDGSSISGCPGVITGLKTNRSFTVTAPGFDSLTYNIGVRTETQYNISTCTAKEQISTSHTESKTKTECDSLSGAFATTDSSIVNCSTYTRTNESSCTRSGGSWSSRSGYGTCRKTYRYQTTQSCSPTYGFYGQQYCSGKNRYSISNDTRSSSCGSSCSCGSNCTCTSSFSPNSSTTGICKKTVSKAKSQCALVNTTSTYQIWTALTSSIGNCTYTTTSDGTNCSTWSTGTWESGNCGSQSSNDCKVTSTRVVYYRQN